MKNKAIVIVLAVVVISGVLCFVLWRDKPKSAPAPQRDPDVIAKVGSMAIRVDAFKREMVRRGGDHPEKLDRIELLNEMIERHALLERAVALGLDKDPDVQRSQQNILIGELRQSQLEPSFDDLNITDTDVINYHRDQIDQFTTPEKRRFAIIFVELNRKGSDQVRQQAHEKLNRVIAEAAPIPAEKGFGKLAIDHSHDQATRYFGGDIGWLSKGTRYKWPDAVVDAGFAMDNIGDCSGVIEDTKGLYLVRLIDRREPHTQPVESVHQKIRHQLIIERRKTLENEFVDTARDAVKVEIFQDVLDRIGPAKTPSTTAAAGPPKMP